MGTYGELSHEGRGIISSSNMETGPLGAALTTCLAAMKYSPHTCAYMAFFMSGDRESALLEMTW